MESNAEPVDPAFLATAQQMLELSQQKTTNNNVNNNIIVNMNEEGSDSHEPGKS